MLFKNEKVQLLIGLSIGLLLFTLPSDKGYILYPLYGMTVVIAVFLFKINKLNNGNLILDIGVIAILATYVYSSYPLINYIIGGYNFGPLSDNRLANLNINNKELGIFHLRHLLYISILALSYVKLRKETIIKYDGYSNLQNKDILALLTLIFVSYFLLNLIQLFISYSPANSNYNSEHRALYLENYNNLPLLVRQILSKVMPIIFLGKLLLIYWIVSKKPKYLSIILIIFILYELLNVFINKGGRSGLIFYCISIVLIYTRLISKISIIKIIISGLIIFLFFNFFGIYRSVESLDSYYKNIIQGNPFGFLVVGNEFQSLLGTQFHVYRWVQDGITIPLSLYFNDFMSILPPQQLLPFKKNGGSDWYLDTFGIAGTGHGYMWGVITQSIIGFDWIEIFIRGLILGLILALYHNWYFLNQNSYFATVFYIYLCVKIYNSFRDTTLIFLVNIVWEIIPFYLMFKFFQFIFNKFSFNILRPRK